MSGKSLTLPEVITSYTPPALPEDLHEKVRRYRVLIEEAGKHEEAADAARLAKEGIAARGVSTGEDVMAELIAKDVEAREEQEASGRKRLMASALLPVIYSGIDAAKLARGVAIRAHNEKHYRFIEECERAARAALDWRARAASAPAYQEGDIESELGLPRQRIRVAPTSPTSPVLAKKTAKAQFAPVIELILANKNSMMGGDVASLVANADAVLKALWSEDLIFVDSPSSVETSSGRFTSARIAVTPAGKRFIQASA